MHEELTPDRIKELQNASQFPSIYYARHMTPGLCRYVDPDGTEETVYLDSETLVKMAPSFVGKPVFILHQKVDLKNIKQQANGYITDSFYNELDGSLWVKFIVIDDDGHDCIEEGWAVSNAYVPLDRAAGGTWHNCPYDSKILDAVFTHMAIVPSPRYEEACILTPKEYSLYQDEKRMRLNELRNSDQDNETAEGTKMKKLPFKMFKSKREEVQTIDADTEIELQNGHAVKVSEMIAAIEEKQNAAQADATKLAALDATVVVNGKTMKVADLAAEYTNMLAEKENVADSGEGDEDDPEADKGKKDKENSVEDDEMENEDDEDGKEKENSEADDDAKAKAAKEKQNAAAPKKKTADEQSEGEKHYKELLNASQASMKVMKIETSQTMVQRGQAKYGSSKAVH